MRDIHRGVQTQKEICREDSYDDETHIPDRAYAPEFAKALGAIPETSILSVEK